MGPASVFFGEVETAGNDQKHLGHSFGLAVDGKGHLLVADKDNHRIVVLNEADGSFADSFAVQAPEWVGVHCRTMAVYVNSGDSLIKFSNWKEGKELARAAPKCFSEKVYVGHGRVRPNLSFALDDGAEPAIVWVGRSVRLPGLFRLEDRGDSFSEPVAIGSPRGVKARNLTAEPLRRSVFGLM